MENYICTINANLIDVQEASISIPANEIGTVLPNRVDLLTVDTEFMWWEIFTSHFTQL